LPSPVQTHERSVPDRESQERTASAADVEKRTHPPSPQAASTSP